MSNNYTSTSSSYTYTSTSTSSSSTTTTSSSRGQAPTQQTHATRQAQTSYTDPSGNTYVKSASQNLGEPIIAEERQYDVYGRELVGDGDGRGGARIEGAGAGNGGGVGDGSAAGSSLRIEDVTEMEKEREQRERDRIYEERIEDEYAKREGGV